MKHMMTFITIIIFAFSLSMSVTTIMASKEQSSMTGFSINKETQMNNIKQEILGKNPIKEKESIKNETRTENT